jgi:hypothetical protein
LRDHLLDQIGAVIRLPTVSAGYLENDALMRLEKSFKLPLTLVLHGFAGFFS